MMPTTIPQPSFIYVMSCGLRLRCPRCAKGHLLAHMLRMNRECAICGLSFFREPGYYVGAMILNYGATSGLLITAYIVAQFFPDVWNASPEVKILVWMAVAVAISLVFVPFSRGAWLAMDYWMEPWAE